jgi:hypothetical protein
MFVLILHIPRKTQPDVYLWVHPSPSTFLFTSNISNIPDVKMNNPIEVGHSSTFQTFSSSNLQNSLKRGTYFCKGRIVLQTDLTKMFIGFISPCQLKYDQMHTKVCHQHCLG